MPCRLLTVTPPDMGSANSWSNYLSNNFQVTAQGYGLTVTLSDAPSLGWGIAPGGGAYLLTQSASDAGDQLLLPGRGLRLPGQPEHAAGFGRTTPTGSFAALHDGL